jgi:hypothetical protein
MWNRSYRWQRHLRLAAGVTILLTLVGASVLLGGTTAARRARAGARDLLSELRSSEGQMIEVQVPANLRTQAGTLVYGEREDGIAQVIGRVVTANAGDRDQVDLVIRLSAPVAGSANRGGVLKGAPASLNFRDAVRLLVSPNTPSEEAMMARDTVWPSIRANLLPDIVDGLIREISADLADPSPEDEALLKRLVENVHEAIEPLEDNLVDRLAKRAWDIVGMQGFAGGFRRATADDPKNKGVSAAPWWSRFFGDRVSDEAVDRPFLTEETSEALKIALEEEAISFWQENRSKIVDALMKAIDERREDFEVAFRERWAGLLYERVIVPAWQTGQDKVIESVQAYVSDFAARRLLTKKGGPRLLFAYVLRGYLDISVAPLLILSPGSGSGSDRVVYEPLLR